MIYIDHDSYETVQWVRNHAYYDREDADNLAPGYFLNANTKFLVLPEDCEIIELSDATLSITMPPELTGTIFSNSPHLPVTLQDSLEFWTPPTDEYLKKHDPISIYYQSPLTEYHIELDSKGEPLNNDTLISDGFVLKIGGLYRMLYDIPSLNAFIKIRVNIVSLLNEATQCDVMHSEVPSIIGAVTTSDIYVDLYFSVSELVEYKRRQMAKGVFEDLLYLNCIRTEMFDYGYFY